MGYGDEIMATAQARAVSENIGVKAGFNEWSKLWKHNPHIAKEGGFPVKNMTGDRPYLLGQTDKKCIFNPNYRAIPGDIYLDHNELRESKKALEGISDFILIQPEVKLMFSKGNKAWPRHHWKALVEMLEGENLVQMLKNRSETEEAIPGVKTIVTETFRTAVATLMKARMIITCDGGLHHAAAARIYDSKGYLLSEGTPAVVIWTGFTHPRNLGYAKHINVRYDDTPPCGMKVSCDHCKNMAEKLTPEMVCKPVREYLEHLSANLDQRKRAG